MIQIILILMPNKEIKGIPMATKEILMGILMVKDLTQIKAIHMLIKEATAQMALMSRLSLIIKDIILITQWTKVSAIILTQTIKQISILTIQITISAQIIQMEEMLSSETMQIRLNPTIPLQI